MGGKSTLQSAVLRDSKTTKSPAFDLRSWQGLTEVLRVGKSSLTQPGAYAEFRNLVLQYAQQGGDAELRTKIDSIIATFKEVSLPSDAVNASPTSTQDVQPEPPKPQVQNLPGAIGVRRIQPRFFTQAASPQQASVAENPVPSAPVPEKTTPDLPPPSASTQSDVINAAIHQAEVTRGIPVVSVAPTRVPTPETVAAESVPSPTPAQQVPVPPSPVVETTQAAPVFKSLEAHKQRISEIKRSVNEHIGNPAALMSSHNELGKRYMTALLSALKASGGSATEGVDGAMARLEDAYTALMSGGSAVSVSNEPKEVPVVATPVQDVPVAAPTPSPVPSAPPLPPVTPSIETTIEPESKESEEEEDAPEPIAAPAPVMKRVIEEKIDVVSNNKPQHDEADSASGYAALYAERESHMQGKAQVSSDKAPRRDLPEIKSAPKRSARSVLTSLLVADEREDRRSVDRTIRPDVGIGLKSDTPMPEKGSAFPQTKYTNKNLAAASPTALSETGVDPSEFAVKQSELASPIITQALHELLSEWSIFSGSGFLGIGPSGPDHPLYLTLAPLSMGEVIAGRFEGANPKTIKIIKEYVDAWRHEQGIAYTITETFEHYLRRVVQRIQKRQTSSVGAY